MDTRRSVYIVGAISILILLEFLANTKNKFVYDNFIAIGFLIIAMIYHKRLHINGITLSLISIFLIMHNLGSFGIYASNFHGMEWDKVVHAFYGFAGSIVAFQFFSKQHPDWKVDRVIVFSIGAILGASVIHEIVEYMGATILGPGDGVLFFGAGDTMPGDTEWDMIYGFLGSYFSMMIVSTGIGLKKIYKIAMKR